MNTEDEVFGRSCINAMIDMGRSVTLVMQKESGPYPDLTQWYVTRMVELMHSADGPLMRFFNERRVHTIHKGVVRPLRDTAMVTSSTLPGVAAGATVILWRFEGTAEYLGSNDSGGMHRLSMRYLTVLRELVRGLAPAAHGSRNQVTRGALGMFRLPLPALRKLATDLDGRSWTNSPIRAGEG